MSARADFPTTGRPVIDFSVREAAARIAAGTLAPLDLLSPFLKRIAQTEGQIGAFEHFDPEEARLRARTLTASGRRGLLAGVPLGVKDNIDTAAMPTTYGSAIYREHRPRADAACAALAADAGALLIGKTVTTEFATFSPGKTRNPRNLAHTPGGSSSGSAAAVAAGMVPVALGTQTAGSIIRPASYCGVVGYKPSFGLIPRVGVKMLSDSLDTVGVLARTVDDAAYVAGVLSNRPALCSLSPVAPPVLAVCRTHEWEAAEPATIAALDRSLEMLQRAGLTVHELAPSDMLRGLAQAHLTIMQREIADAMAWEHQAHPALLSPRLRDLLRAGRCITAKAYDAAKQQAASARAALQAFVGAADAVIVPAVPGEAPSGLAATGDTIFCRVWSLLHAPAITLPAGTGPKGLPIGIQLVGAIDADARLLAAAMTVERILAP